MFLSIFNYLANVDPQVENLLDNMMSVGFPILYAVAGVALIFTTVKFSLKIHNNPEEKGVHFKHLVISWIACGGVFMAEAIGHIFTADYLGLI